MRIERFHGPTRGLTSGTSPKLTRSLGDGSSESGPQDTMGAIKWNESEYQDLRKDARRAAEDGKIPLIISADNEAGVGPMADVCKQFVKSSDTTDLPLVNGMTTRVDSRQLKRFLTSLPDGSNVIVDLPLTQTGGANPNRIFQEAVGQTVSPSETSACRLPGLSKVHDMGYRGQGETMVLIDSGLFPHADFKGKVDGYVDLVENKTKWVDPYGHATKMAGIAVGDGSKSDQKIMGVAPEAHLFVIRIASVGDAIKALQLCVDNKDKHHLSAINLSLGDTATRPWGQDPWALAAQKAIDAGLDVVVAAGNNGAVATPGILPDAITVGAVDDKGTCDPSDDILASFSPKGQLVDGVQKPDLLAPGVGVWTTVSPASTLDRPELPHFKTGYIASSGTSEAAVDVTGLVLLLRQARPDLSPRQRHEILEKTAHHYANIADLDQGAGLPQADKAMEMALAMPKGGGAQTAMA